jgi:hypothetical protein
VAANVDSSRPLTGSHDRRPATEALDDQTGSKSMNYATSSLSVERAVFGKTDRNTSDLLAEECRLPGHDDGQPGRDLRNR